MSDLNIAFASNKALNLKYKDRRLEIISHGDGIQTKSGKIDELNRVSDNPLQVSLARFELIKAIANLDVRSGGSANDISDADLSKAKSLKGSVFGNNYVNQYKLVDVSDMDREGKITFTLAQGNDKAYVTIDTETDDEKAARENKEKADADARRAQEAEARQAQEQRNRRMQEHQNNLRNDPIYRGIDRVMNWLGRPFKP